jgi:galactose mutarotase-like enzyme
MNATIENGLYAASVSSLGAELKSLRDKALGREYLWQADPAWWKGTAPVLFPIVGGLKGGKYRFGGSEYELPQHGFARTSEFTVVANSRESVEFEFRSGPETRAKYPFDFRLRVGFALERNGISVRYAVTNEGNGPMRFSIGSHPAINVPFDGGKFENHYIVFEREERPERYFFKDGLVVAGKTADVFENSKVISLTRNLFDDGPVILKGIESSSFAITNGMTGKSVIVAADGVPPYLGIWSKPNGAPFVCIEPWHGLPDSTDATGELTEKEGILALEPRAEFTTGYRIEIT